MHPTHADKLNFENGYADYAIDYVRLYQTGAIGSQMVRGDGQYVSNESSKNTVIMYGQPNEGLVVLDAETVKEKAAVKEDLTGKTVAELRELAKAKEVKGYSTMKKAELLEALK